MTDIDPNSPANLRALMLYDIFQRKTMQKSIGNYRVLCETLGKKAISYDEYELCFNRCLNKNYKRDLSIPDSHACILADVINGKSAENSMNHLSEGFKNLKIDKDDHDYWFNRFDSGHLFNRVTFYSNKITKIPLNLFLISEKDLPIPDIRGCILSDVINGKSAEKSFDDLCDAFNNHKIDKEDHEYWYKRFENGHLFSSVTFSDFPEDFAEIVDRCDMKSYLNLRNVSSGLRTVIDHLAPPCSVIGVYCEYGIKAYVDGTLIANSEHFNILELLLRNPKLRLKRFGFITSTSLRTSYPTTEIKIPPRYCKKHFLDLFNSLNHKIHAKKCVIEVNSKNDMIEVLKCLKPGTLENLDINTGFVKEINEIASMNQWKLAKHLKITTSELPSIENFFHFTTFDLEYPPISIEDMVKLCENASKTNRFQYCEVQIQKKFELETIKRVLNFQPTSSSKIYTIPNTNLFIQFISSNIFESKQKFDYSGFD